MFLRITTANVKENFRKYRRKPIEIEKAGQEIHVLLLNDSYLDIAEQDQQQSLLF
jgi:hypothetical protein